MVFKAASSKHLSSLSLFFKQNFLSSFRHEAKWSRKAVVRRLELHFVLVFSLFKWRSLAQKHFDGSFLTRLWQLTTVYWTVPKKKSNQIWKTERSLRFSLLFFKKKNAPECTVSDPLGFWRDRCWFFSQQAVKAVKILPFVVVICFPDSLSEEVLDFCLIRFFILCLYGQHACWFLQLISHWTLISPNHGFVKKTLKIKKKEKKNKLVWFFFSSFPPLTF